MVSYKRRNEVFFKKIHGETFFFQSISSKDIKNIAYNEKKKKTTGKTHSIQVAVSLRAQIIPFILIINFSISEMKNFKKIQDERSYFG